MKPYFIISAIICLLSACKTTQIKPDTELAQIPVSFENYTDTLNIVNRSWPEYFSDITLTNLINQALQNNPDLTIAQQKIEMARAELTFRKGMQLPTLDALGWAGQARTGEYSVNWAGNEGGQFLTGDALRPTYNDYYLGFQSSWEADLWGKLKNRKKAAISRFYASSEGRNWVLSNLIAELASTYYNLLSLDENQLIIKETIALQENALSTVKSQKEAGKANQLAVQQFETQLLSLRGLEKETIQQITEAEYRINLLMGQFPQKIKRDRSSFNDLSEMKIAPGLPQQLLINRSDIRQAELELLATKADVKAARAAFYPSIGLSARFGYNAFQMQYLFRNPQSIAYDIFGNITAPILNRSSIKAEFQYSNAAQIEALFLYQKTLLAAYSEVSLELKNIENLQAIYDLKVQEVNVLSKSIETSSELFKTGRATYLEVLITQQNALQSRLELIDSKENLYYAKVNLYKVLGGGWK
ncbi:MAG: TolC family protein [Cyclobacteriaceae bacterium]